MGRDTSLRAERAFKRLACIALFAPWGVQIACHTCLGQMRVVVHNGMRCVLPCKKIRFVLGKRDRGRGDLPAVTTAAGAGCHPAQLTTTVMC